MCHMSSAMRHVSCVSCPVSCVRCHFSLLMIASQGCLKYDLWKLQEVMNCQHKGAWSTHETSVEQEAHGELQVSVSRETVLVIGVGPNWSHLNRDRDVSTKSPKSTVSPSPPEPKWNPNITYQREVIFYNKTKQFYSVAYNVIYHLITYSPK